MVLFQSFDDLLSYELHYPVEEWVMIQFKRRQNKKLDYFQFLQEFTSNHIGTGFRKYREFEEEWFALKRLLQEQIDNFNQTGYFPTYNFLILLDQALLLEHEGNHIPNPLR